MSMDAEYSLVRYDPRQGMLGHPAAGYIRPPLGRPGAPSPRADIPSSDFMAERPHRQDPLLSLYSPRRMIATATTAATGQIVDIFV